MFPPSFSIKADRNNDASSLVMVANEEGEMKAVVVMVDSIEALALRLWHLETRTDRQIEEKRRTRQNYNESIALSSVPDILCASEAG